MNHVVIVAWTAENRVAKYQDFKTPAECRKHVDRVKDTWPAAFVTTAPSGAAQDWLVDPTAKTLSLNPVPAPVRIPGDMMVIQDALITKGVITLADLNTSKTKLTR